MRSTGIIKGLLVCGCVSVLTLGCASKESSSDNDVHAPVLSEYEIRLQEEERIAKANYDRRMGHFPKSLNSKIELGLLADKMTSMSFHHNDADNKVKDWLGEYVVINKMLVEDAAQATMINLKLEETIFESNRRSTCFEPSHYIRFESDEGPVELRIAFTCKNLKTYVNGKYELTLGLSPALKSIFESRGLISE